MLQNKTYAPFLTEAFPTVPSTLSGTHSLGDLTMTNKHNSRIIRYTIGQKIYFSVNFITQVYNGRAVEGIYKEKLEHLMVEKTELQQFVKFQQDIERRKPSGSILGKKGQFKSRLKARLQSSS